MTGARKGFLDPHVVTLELATSLMDDKIKVTAQDMATKRQAMKKAGAATPATKKRNGRKKGGRKAGRKAVPRPAAAQPAPASVATADVFGHIDAIREAVGQLGAEQVNKIVGLFE